MMRLPVLIFFLLLFNSFGQILPDIDWSHAGLSMTAPVVKEINFREVKSSFSADVTDDVVINQIIKENKDGAIIFFPAGQYTFNEQIKLTSNIILRGEGHQSKLIFDLEKPQDCIVAKGKMLEFKFDVLQDLNPGDSLIEVSTIQGITKGDTYYISSRDGRLVQSEWAIGKTGQIVTVREIMDNQICISKIRRFHIRFDKPTGTKIETVRFVGVEDLSIINNTKTELQTSNVKFELASNCWVKNVRSTYCNYTHILLEFSANCEVSNCVLEKSHNYGNGGKGYGVTFQFGTSECLAGNNFCDSLRHAFLLQAGANGNVISMNHSQNPYWTNVWLPKDASGDIVLHGNYPYANLIQFNVCNTIVVDNSHGSNGLGNLFFSNHLLGYGILCSGKSGNQAFINNCIEKAAGLKGKYRVRGYQYEQYNKVGNKIKPKGSLKFIERENFFK